ncbi:PREDICTED: uncharacterized protein LOC109586528 [Amphimedon queenslandica]|uniref:Uncharacterized protein n=1 Tax=Amphimedon queenslandica TaxID=400682 RepID=A0AAN0JN95_AMPQE|nr:PREDICTED: uncharacterized protein LOC109586528 [Amphimedon queenslandica]|eukprot:XP_019858286.1 PREDICTED: uncharacterized protein LOC109586528 [Amphimedon queenslandica]
MGSPFYCLLVLSVLLFTVVEKAGCEYDTDYGSSDTETKYGTYSGTSSISRRKSSRYNLSLYKYIKFNYFDAVAFLFLYRQQENNENDGNNGGNNGGQNVPVSVYVYVVVIGTAYKLHQWYKNWEKSTRTFFGYDY